MEEDKKCPHYLFLLVALEDRDGETLVGCRGCGGEWWTGDGYRRIIPKGKWKKPEEHIRLY